MAIRPLIRFRVARNNVIVPQYGDQQYITANNAFVIVYAHQPNVYAHPQKGWVIVRHNMQGSQHVHAAAQSAGLLEHNTRFPRLRDAVNALESVMEAMD